MEPFVEGWNGKRLRVQPSPAQLLPSDLALLIEGLRLESSLAILDHRGYKEILTPFSKGTAFQERKGYYNFSFQSGTSAFQC